MEVSIVDLTGNISHLLILAVTYKRHESLYLSWARNMDLFLTGAGICPII